MSREENDTYTQKPIVVLLRVHTLQILVWIVPKRKRTQEQYKPWKHIHDE